MAGISNALLRDILAKIFEIWPATLECVVIKNIAFNVFFRNIQIVVHEINF